jgi:hypothetical protein
MDARRKFSRALQYRVGRDLLLHPPLVKLGAPFEVNV